jgi:hypothetical protein
MSYIGALGVSTFDDEIEDPNNTLVNRIVSDINNTINYECTTSNILVGCIRDTSNVLVQRITDEVGHTSNYADRLDLRIKTLEGSEGSPGDISLGIPVIPSTGGFYDSICHSGSYTCELFGWCIGPYDGNFVRN